MTLVLEIEYLSGVCFAAIGPDSPVPDWPPQPDRVFSALVATWAARGKIKEEGEALEWLESLQVPKVIHSEAAPRTGAVVYVPPNDPRLDRQKNAKGVLPALRSRQPRRFPAVRPEDAVVRFLWPDVEPEPAALAVLSRLARDTSYVGHSTSLTRCRFFVAKSDVADPRAKPAERCVYRERFAELRREFDAGRRPMPGTPVRSAPAVSAKRQNVFGDRWLILEHAGGVMPDVRGAAVVARAIRDTFLSAYRRIGLEERIPEEISGHAADGRPSQRPHSAIVPLPFVGFPHADGHVLGFALVPTADSAILEANEFLWALRAVAPVVESRGRRILSISSKQRTPGTHAFSIELSPTLEVAKRSLDPTIYLRESAVFATVTPIVLDRHLKERGSARSVEIEHHIATACRNIGIPEPDRIVIGRHSAIEGVPSARPSGKSPRWTGWRLPPSLASRERVHAVLCFKERVKGPVLIGAGRYVGLGLCRPLG